MEENIVLQSLDYSPAAITPPDEAQRVIERKITSRGPSKTVRFCHKLYNVRFIESEKATKNSDEPCKIDYYIGFLDPQPLKKWRYSKLAVIILVFTAVLSVAVLLLKVWLVASALILSSGLAAYRLFLSLEKNVVFQSMYGEAPLLFLSFKNKNKETIDEFVKLLKQRITKNPLPESVNVLPEETKLLRRFYEAGFFSKGEYECHRDKILKRYPSKPR